MKKVLLIVIGLILVISIVTTLVLLNRTKVVTCNNTLSINGYKLETYYTINYKKDIVKTIRVEEYITSDDDKVLNDYEDQFNKQYEYNNKVYGGYEYKVTKKNKKVETNVLIDYDKLDMDKFIKNNEVMKDYTDNNKLTIDGAIKLYEDSGAICKK